MAHCANGPMSIFGIGVGLLLAAGVTEAATPRAGPPINVDVSSLQELRQAVERATPGSIIRLGAGTYQLFADDPPIRFSGPHGLPDQPIVIRGTPGPAGSRPTIIDGSRSLDGALAMVEQFGRSGGPSRDLEEVITQNQYRTRQAVNCLVFEGAANVIIEDHPHLLAYVGLFPVEPLRHAAREHDRRLDVPVLRRPSIRSLRRRG